MTKPVLSQRVAVEVLPLLGAVVVVYPSPGEEEAELTNLVKIKQRELQLRLREG